MDAGADMDRVSLEDKCPTFPAGLPKLRELCAPTPQFAPQLLFLDPFGYYANGIAVEKEAAGYLAELAQDLDICVFVSRHIIRAVTSAVTAGAGSHQIMGRARLGFLVAPNPRQKGTQAMACVKNNIGPKHDSFRYTLTGNGVLWGPREVGLEADDIAARVGRRRLREETAKALREYLEERPRLVTEVKGLLLGQWGELAYGAER